MCEGTGGWKAVAAALGLCVALLRGSVALKPGGS